MSNFEATSSDRLGGGDGEQTAALTDADMQVAQSLLKLTNSLRIPKDTLGYLVEYLAMNQPPVPVSHLIGYSGLRLVGGVVNDVGTVISGIGFTAAKEATGQYRVTFNPAFPETPVGLATPYQTVGTIDKGIIVVALQATHLTVQLITASTGVAVDQGFTFLASEAH